MKGPKGETAVQESNTAGVISYPALQQAISQVS